MATGSGSLHSSQTRRSQTDFGEELAKIHVGSRDSPLASRVEHLQGLFAEGIAPVIADCQQRMLQQAQEAFERQDLDGAENILRDRVFEVKIGDADITTNLRAQIDAAKAQIESDQIAAGHLLEAEKAMQDFDFSSAREALDKARACSPSNGALNELRRLEDKYAIRPTKEILDAPIKGTDVNELDNAERQREQALSRTNSAATPPMGSPESAASTAALPPAPAAEAHKPRTAAPKAVVQQQAAPKKAAAPAIDEG